MKHTTKSRRARAIALGALLASVISIGAAADTASAARPDPTSEGNVEVTVQVSTMSLRSGIRW